MIINSKDVRRVPVKIYERDYLIRSDESVQYVNQLSQTLDRKMREISHGNKNILEVKVAVLAALNILDEYYKLKKQYDELEGLLEDETAVESYKGGRDIQEVLTIEE